jgi:hypothetical protein
VGTDTTWIMALPPPDEARRHLGRLIRLARLARQWPLPYWPRTAGVALHKTNSQANSQANSHEPAPNGTPFLEAAQAHWSSDRQDNMGETDSERPATRMLFRGCDNPFDWRPEGLPDWLPYPGTPLAWRVMCEIEAWRAPLRLTSP